MLSKIGARNVPIAHDERVAAPLTTENVADDLRVFGNVSAIDAVVAKDKMR